MMGNEFNNLPPALQKMLEQFDPNDLQQFLNNMNGNDMQQLLNAAITMLQQNMSEQEKETLNLLLKSFLSR